MGRERGGVHLLEFGVVACESVEDFASEVFEWGSGERGQFVAGLVTFWTKSSRTRTGRPGRWGLCERV